MIDYVEFIIYKEKSQKLKASTPAGSKRTKRYVTALIMQVVSASTIKFASQTGRRPTSTAPRITSGLAISPKVKNA